MKTGRIFDQDAGSFGLEYDNTQGKKHTMRLDADSYEKAVREARTYLGIRADDHDEDGHQWTIE